MCGAIKEKPMKKISENSGYTLIEMAIVMTIVGLMIASFFSVYDTYLVSKRVTDTEINVIRLTNAIGSFRGQYGRYPCPASLTAPRTDPAYGRETNCTDISVAPGTNPAANGYAVEVSMREIDTDNDGTPDPGSNPRVRSGAIPFRVLNMPEEIAYDGYGNRINYVVTEIMASSATFDVNDGGIGIIDDMNQSLVAVPDSGHFLIFSSGMNEAGAFTRNGGQVLPCPAAGIESENCNSVVDSNAVYAQIPTSTSGDINNFDDRLAFYAITDLSYWKISASDPNDIRDRMDGFVGFNDDNPDNPADPDNVAEVGGDMRAQGDLMSAQICDGSGSGADCFSASLIGGTGMKCPAGQYMTGIQNGTPVCNPVVTKTCEDGKVLKGINADGTLDCTDAPCGSQTVTHCSTNITMPTVGDGATFKAQAGTNFYQWYICKSNTWKIDNAQGGGGSCNCTASTTTKTKGCGKGFTGDKIVTETKSCPSGTTSVTEDKSACVCVNTSETRSKKCSKGFNEGGASEKRDWICSSTTAGNWTKWTSTGSATPCSCEEENVSEELNCTGGLAGKYWRYKEFECPGESSSPGKWTGWDYPAAENYCFCDSSKKETKKTTCPKGQAGAWQQERRYICTGSKTGYWGAWVDKVNTCKTPPPKICTLKTKTPAGTVSSPGPGPGDSCICGTKNPVCYTVINAGSLYQQWTCTCN